MSRRRPPRIPRREDELFVYHSPPSARKNPGIDFRRRPRLDMQLCWVGGYDQGSDMEWWNGPWGVFLSLKYLGGTVLILGFLQTVQTQSWSVNGTAAGTWVDSRDLTYVKVCFTFVDVSPSPPNPFTFTHFLAPSPRNSLLDLQCLAHGSLRRTTHHTRYDASIHERQLCFYHRRIRKDTQ